MKNTFTSIKVIVQKFNVSQKREKPFKMRNLKHQLNAFKVIDIHDNNAYTLKWIQIDLDH